MHEKEFGNLKINISQLNRNKLSLTTPAGKYMYKREIISDALKEIIKDLINGKKDLDEYVNLLSDKDQQILNEVLKVCKIDNDFESRHYHCDTHKDKLIQRFNVLRDEIMIGNESSDLLDEFSEILDRLFEKKLITLKEFNKLKKLL